jgi:hypothetical protein
MKELIPVGMIERKILLIRGEKVMLDADLPHSIKRFAHKGVREASGDAGNS